MKKKFNYIYLFSILAVLVSCDLNQEIEIELPEYTPQITVECYVQNGKPFNLLLTKSIGYFDPLVLDPQEYLEQILVNDAQISIVAENVTYELVNGAFLDPTSFTINNYAGSEPVSFDPGTNLALEIKLADGTILNANTSVVEPIEIDSISIEFNEVQQDMARCLIFGDDIDPEVNYVRRMLHDGSLDSLVIDFVATDEFTEGDRFIFGSDYSFERGDTVINTLIHINKEYYDFYQSVQGAAFVNGNPFGQPGQLISNIEGEGNPIGIFTSISVDTTFTIIPE